MLATTPSILITDDDRGLRETLQGVFEPRGFRTLLAADGQEAFEIVQREEVHLLLLDMHMPRLTGLETIRLVKQFRALLPCILMSADADQKLVEQALALRAFTVLSKPVTQRAITTTVTLAFRQVYNWPEAAPADPDAS